MRWLSVCLSLVMFGSAAAAREMIPAEKRLIPFQADLPLCSDPGVLEAITARFAEKERIFWNSNATIVQYEHIRPIAWRPWGLDTVPRRFCTAIATVSNGARHTVNYSVREDLGFSSFDNGTEFCVVGYDRNRAYAPLCRLARP